MLFSSYTRDNADHKRRKETAFEFLDRSAWKISELVRQKVNELRTSYEPDDEFIKMFKPKSDKQHYSAVFELLTHSLFSLSNFSLIRHPETITGKRPDFKATVNEFKIFLECTLAGHSFDSLTDKIIQPALTEINILCIRGDEIYNKQRIIDDIWNSLKKGRFVLAELTGKNPKCTL